MERLVMVKTNLILNIDDPVVVIVNSIYPTVTEMLSTLNYFDDITTIIRTGQFNLELATEPVQ
ncbi:hypothetical protein ACS0TY_023963 [Phlomoides rotata]